MGADQYSKIIAIFYCRCPEINLEGCIQKIQTVIKKNKKLSFCWMSHHENDWGELLDFFSPALYFHLLFLAVNMQKAFMCKKKQDKKEAFF